MNDIIPVIRREDGILFFDNYDALKSWLTAGAKDYLKKEYSSIAEALYDKKELETVKEKLKEVKEDINKPYADVNAKLDELLKIIQEPLSRINKYKKEYERIEKEIRIKTYIYGHSDVLGAYKDKIADSAAFIEDEWFTVKFTDKKWKDAVDAKMATIVQDINTIYNIGGDHKNALLARYYETLSLDNAKEYLENLKSDVSGNLETVNDYDKTIGYKVLKIYGTSRQMSQVLDELDLLNLEYEELEDGMPQEFKEILVPEMDSFVAFDIETSGSEGAVNDALPSDITEIGAVKVINGKIIETFSELCNPGRPIMPRIARLTGITNEMVADKPSVNEIIKQFKDFCGDLPLVGHNIKSMDLHYISAAAKRNGIEFSNRFFDTYLYAKRFKEAKGWDNVKLEYLAGQYGIRDESHHRACNDAEVNVAVYYKLKNENTPSAAHKTFGDIEELIMKELPMDIPNEQLGKWLEEENVIDEDAFFSEVMAGGLPIEMFTEEMADRLYVAYENIIKKCKEQQ